MSGNHDGSHDDGRSHPGRDGERATASIATLDPLLADAREVDGHDGHRPPREPGRTLAASHLSSAPPDLGPVRKSLDENKAILDAVMGVGVSFDVIYRELDYHGTRISAYCINGLFESTDNILLMRLVDWLSEEEEHPRDRSQPRNRLLPLEGVFQRRLGYSQVTHTKDLNKLAFEVMSGPLGLLIDGSDEALIVDIRVYPDRNPDVPLTERIVRGPHDGFVETLVYNTAMIRRRIRDPRLRFEIMQVGTRSRMDVSLAYLEGLTDPALVDQMRRKLKSIDIDGIPAAEQTVAELLTGHNWNPFPTVRFTERPDVAAFHLLEGHALVLVDTTPQAIIAPSTLWNHLQHIEDFHLNPVVGTYMRWVQFIGAVFATLIPPIWLLIAIDPRMAHALPALSFIGPKKPSHLALGLQMVGAEVTLDILRRAMLNTPASLSAAMGFVGAIVLGDVAAKTGIFTPEVLVYIVLAAIGQFAVSSLELGMALRTVRLSMVVAVWAFRLPGLAVAALLWIVVVLGTRTFGVPYTYPLLPFDWPALRGMLVREPQGLRLRRPIALRPQDRTRT